MRREIFESIRAARGKGFVPEEVRMVDVLLDRLQVPPDEPERRRIGAKGLALIKAFEGLRLKAYRCPADVPTIGYGSTGSHVRMGMEITEAEAEALLRKDLERFERGVEAIGPSTQDQFDAMMSLAFNVGLGAFNGSTLVRKHKVGDFEGAANEFARWNRAGGRVLPGLSRRRKAEADLYRGRM